MKVSLKCPLHRGSDQHIYTDNSSNSRRRLYVGLEAVHVNGAVFFALLQVPWGNRRLLPLRRRPDALLQLNQTGHVGRDELVLEPWRRGPVVAIVVVAVHQRRGVDRRLGLADQRHLWASRVTGKEDVKGKWKHVRKEIDSWEGCNVLKGAGLCVILSQLRKFYYFPAEKITLLGLRPEFKLTPSPSFMKSFLQMCAMMPVAKASPITFTMVRNLSL